MSTMRTMAVLCVMLISQAANAQNQKMQVMWSFCNPDGSLLRAYEDICRGGTVYLKNRSLFGVTQATPNGYTPNANQLTGVYRVGSHNSGVPIGEIQASAWPPGSVYAFQVPDSSYFDQSQGLNFTIHYVQQGMGFAGPGAQSTSFYLHTHQLPAVNAGADQTICKGSPISVSPSGASTYIWSPSIPSVANASATYTATGSVTYNTQFSNPVQTITCKNTDAMTITVNPLPNLLYFPYYEYCTGTPLPVLITNQGLSSYVWYKDQGVLSGEVSNSLNTATYGYGTYKLVATGTNGCSATKSINIKLSPSAYGNLSANFTSTTSNNSSTMTINALASQATGEHRWELYTSNEAGDLLSLPLSSTVWSSSTNYSFSGLPLWTYYAVVHYIKDDPCEEVRSHKKVFYQTAKKGMAERENPSENASILVYPNPSIDVFTIEFGTAVSGQLEIIDLLGKKIQSKQLNDVSSCQFDLSGFAKGVYTLNMNIEGVTQTKKVVLQ